MARQAKKVKVGALNLTNRLLAMIKKVHAGDVDAELKDTIAKLALALSLVDIEVDVELDKLATKHAGEIGGSSIVQDPAWRATVGAARGTKKKK